MTNNKKNDLSKKLKLTAGLAATLWFKCPNCKDLVYRRDVVKTNNCPKCEYSFPYSFAKLREIEEFLKTNPTRKELSDAILKKLDSVENFDQKSSLLTMITRRLIENSEKDRFVVKRQKKN